MTSIYKIAQPEKPKAVIIFNEGVEGACVIKIFLYSRRNWLSRKIIEWIFGCKVKNLVDRKGNDIV